MDQALGPVAVWLTPTPLVTYKTGVGRVSSDGARVYRQGLQLLARQGASGPQVAWHHVASLTPSGGRGRTGLAEEAADAARHAGVATNALLGARSACISARAR